MPRLKNDGGGRWGGRAKGTPNKPKPAFNDWLLSLMDKNRKTVEQGIKDLEPKEAAKVLAGMAVALSKPDYTALLNQLCQMGAYIVQTPREGCWRLTVSRFEDNQPINTI